MGEINTVVHCSAVAQVNAKFREHVMHGSMARAQAQVGLGADAGDVEPDTGRSALHKAAFWNHTHMLPWLLERVDPNLQDYNGEARGGRASGG